MGSGKTYLLTVRHASLSKSGTLEHTVRMIQGPCSFSQPFSADMSVYLEIWKFWLHAQVSGRRGSNGLTSLDGWCQLWSLPSRTHVVCSVLNSRFSAINVGNTFNTRLLIQAIER